LSEPPKIAFGKTERATAPAASNDRSESDGIEGSRSTPREGEAGFQFGENMIPDFAMGGGEIAQRELRL